eukprot:CAMPEP_0182856368 /NCGR_PEP_ID=MMETSP0034_2-20130328/2392_1 /TAXON_ID=156128 /ORGANISM="Nephroselmis pyriformis, Strain CCMP717" /LENGTH=212 /DNA_ID=CAMNT_0024987433 /DNA_START=80 /DNA_END=715 /DNA_ORIENTATION=+
MVKNPVERQWKAGQTHNVHGNRFLIVYEDGKGMGIKLVSKGTIRKGEVIATMCGKVYEETDEHLKGERMYVRQGFHMDLEELRGYSPHFGMLVNEANTGDQINNANLSAARAASHLTLCKLEEEGVPREWAKDIYCATLKCARAIKQGDIVLASYGRRHFPYNRNPPVPSQRTAARKAAPSVQERFKGDAGWLWCRVCDKPVKGKRKAALHM